jgi:hypothetical protein
MPTDMDADALAKFLRWCHSRSFPRKYQSGLFSAAVFDPDKPSPDGTRRGRDNIDHMGPLFVMDFENGMRPEEFAALFPHTRLIICNLTTDPMPHVSG